MKDLQKEYLRVLNLSEKLGREFLCKREYKKDREWWVLGAMINMLRENGSFCDVEVEEQENPDFRLKITSRELDVKVEICEVLLPGRIRGKKKIFL